MSTNSMTPNDLIQKNQKLLNKSIVPAMARSLDSVNPVLSQFIRTALDTSNTEHVQAVLRTASESLPLDDFLSEYEKNIANNAEPADRPDNFSVPVVDAKPAKSEDKINDVEHDAHSNHDMKR